MNGDVATAAAYRPADRRVQLENVALNEFDTAMFLASVEHPLGDGLPATPLLFHARLARRVRVMNIAVARVAAQLARIEGGAS